MDIANKIAAAATTLNIKPVSYLISHGVPKNAAISMCILALTKEGLTVAQAIDAVLGEGTFKGIADEVWEINNAKAA